MGFSRNFFANLKHFFSTKKKRKNKKGLLFLGTIVSKSQTVLCNGDSFFFIIETLQLYTTLSKKLFKIDNFRKKKTTQINEDIVVKSKSLSSNGKKSQRSSEKRNSADNSNQRPLYKKNVAKKSYSTEKILSAKKVDSYVAKVQSNCSSNNTRRSLQSKSGKEVQSTS